MPLSSSIPSMQRAGIRRLLIVSGDTDWHQQVIAEILPTLCSSLLWVGESAPQGVRSIAPHLAKGVLGQELGHVIFNAAAGFHAEALAAVAGAISAGHWLIILVPEWEQWDSQSDLDSLRWSEQPEPIATPHFVHHFQRITLEQPEIAIWKQNSEKEIPALKRRPEWLRPNGLPTAEQTYILQALLNDKQPINVVIGERGRGKSTLAGMLAERVKGKCWVTGPSKIATQILSQRGEGVEFYAPDALLEQCRQQAPVDIDWLLIDEAAAIPAPMLRELIAFFPQVLLTTTVQGYEGTGRGFLLKFCASLPSCCTYLLDQPMRWAISDPVESWLKSLLLFEEPQEPQVQNLEFKSEKLSQSQWLSYPKKMCDFYMLLTSAHYKTTPLDLRRLMDGVGNHLYGSFAGDVIAAALWMVDEGGLDESLAKAVWAGERRPKGSLVAQSLAAHGGQWQAAVLRSRRISRIAVFPAWRRQGVAKSLVNSAVQQAREEGLDYVSVSFGYTPELYHFWQQCGFELVRFGTHLEASSGCYTAMAILPFNENSRSLLDKLRLRLRRDGYFIQQKLKLQLPLRVVKDLSLNHDDWDELHGFAYSSRPLDVSIYALIRCADKLSNNAGNCILNDFINESGSVELLCEKYKLSGKKALVAMLRNIISHLIKHSEK
ncbi:tRNA(Met) cytidine acetyltransferase TmcA [Hafnia alvei]|uniref:tRNA(Met) cytidine acetyltransferase TmcA n=1 Tax=Hafnia alvei TaxID=569 RepID=A0A1C6Z7S3_HAFAL|nr:GNAT family N-acetyltransferase [Hafnia alvei]SCM54959.1 tRNA(Met) cytidine acetyltransferase [Hafnia alvei]